MGLLIDKERCNGCGGRFRCADICPGILLTGGADGKAMIRDGADCWDCSACVKVCPREALSLTLPKEVGGQGARLSARVLKDAIRWTIEDPDGQKEIIDVPNRKII